MNRIAIGIFSAIAVGVSYAGFSFYNLGQLDYKGQAALVAVSSFSLTTSAFLLRDMSKFNDGELGLLSPERPSLVIGLIFVCIYVPLSIGTTFLEVYRQSNAVAQAPAIRPASDKISSNQAKCHAADRLINDA